jgi:calcineurin-like phosphoesterase family protein
MCVVRFAADHHFGHESCAKRRGFSDADEMNEYIIEKHNEVVRKKDLTYFLGDITMETDKFYPLLDKMNGRKIAIMGNHDLPKHVHSLLDYVEDVGAIVKYKGVFLTHAPIHPQELEYRVPINIHGHLHEYSVVKDIIKGTRNTENRVIDPRYICVSMEHIQFTPKTLEELGIKLKK